MPLHVIHHLSFRCVNFTRRPLRFKRYQHAQFQRCTQPTAWEPKEKGKKNIAAPLVYADDIVGDVENDGFDTEEYTEEEFGSTKPSEQKIADKSATTEQFDDFVTEEEVRCLSHLPIPDSLLPKIKYEISKFKHHRTQCCTIKQRILRLLKKATLANKSLDAMDNPIDTHPEELVLMPYMKLSEGFVPLKPQRNLVATSKAQTL